jgi:glycosyltransferase involved in cell wall biosynthesis
MSKDTEAECRDAQGLGDQEAREGRRIAVVMNTYCLGVSVAVVETIRALAKAGYEVDLFIAEGAYAESPAQFDSERIHLLVVPEGQAPRTRNRLAGLPRKLKLLGFALQHWLLPGLGLHGSLGEFADVYRKTRWPFVQGIGDCFRNRRYQAVIAVEVPGLIAATLAVDEWRPQTPLIYYNMELLQHARGVRPGMHILKHFEIICARRCIFTVIADEHRGRVFSRANGIPQSRLRYLPVSTEGDPITKRGTRFHEQFRLPPETVVVLYAGNVYRPWALAEEIAQSVRDWPEGCVLVMHTWRLDAADVERFQRIRAASDPARVFFSTQPVSPEEVPRLLSSAHVGLAFYRALDENFTESGCSSNKLAQYARAGLPVVASNFPSIERVLRRFHSGLCVAHPRGIGGALSSILADYDQFRRGAFRSYQEQYRFSSKFKPILEEINQLAQS